METEAREREPVVTTDGVFVGEEIDGHLFPLLASGEVASVCVFCGRTIEDALTHGTCGAR